MKKYLLFGVIASVLSLNAYAVSATVTSKDYVDAMDGEVYDELDASKQNKIPESGVNIDENGPGETVVTYTDEAGVLGERGIYDGLTDYDDLQDQYKLVTASVIFDGGRQNLVTTKTCTEWVANASHTDENCLLWQLSDVSVYGKQCRNNDDCYSQCNNCAVCVNGLCECREGCTR